MFFSHLFIFVIYIVRCLGAYFFPDIMYKRYTNNEPNSNNTCHSGQLSLLPFVGREMSSSLRATGLRSSLADWGDGMSACCKPRVQLFVHAGNGWPRYH